MQNWKCVLWDLLLIQYVRRIFKAFEPRLLIHNGFSLVDYINSMCCFSKRVHAMKTLYSKALNYCPWKIIIVSWGYFKNNSFYSYLEWGCVKRRDTKLLFLTEHATEKVQERIFFENSLKRLLQGNIAFQIWTIGKWELLNDNDHPLDLMNKLFFACTCLSALSSHGADAPSPVRILHSPSSYTSKGDIKGMVYMVFPCPCWTKYGETISTIAKHALPHETRSREWDCHLNSPLLNLLHEK